MREIQKAGPVSRLKRWWLHGAKIGIVMNVVAANSYAACELEILPWVPSARMPTMNKKA